ncbi:MAG TPA: PDZ domain-containing protein [Bryobacteraceae bacterium]|nr:PDZ domain-containing protein [Bryobacteraceae bacterium]
MKLTLAFTLMLGLLFSGIANAQDMFGVAPQVTVTTTSSRSYLGVGVAEINAERAKALKLKEERGVEITRVEDDSPAAKAGLKVGDVVLEYNGQRLEGTEQFVRMVRETPEGRQARLLVSREGSTQTVTAAIGARKGSLIFGQPVDAERLRADAEKLRGDMDKLYVRVQPMPDIPSPNMSWRSGVLGIEAESMGSQLAEFFGVKEGVLVRSVSKDSAAERAGLKAGDVILKIDETKVTSPREITSAIRGLKSKTTFPITLVRSHKEMTVTATVATQKSEGPTPAPARQVSTGTRL